MKTLRGVNLGGWLVLERWMTPGLFAGTDAIEEYTFMQTPGAREKIRDHQKNFIREEDFRWLKEHGVDAVRIPVGYWIFEGDAPYVSAIGRLDWAFRMAEKYDLQVLVCLHGAPGSQNGRDHSGRIGRAAWYDDARYRDETRAVLVRLAQRYRDHPQLWGIELLNEPRTKLWQGMLRKFYRDSARELRTILRDSTRIVFHDAFTPRLMRSALRHETLDIHWYHFAFWAHAWAPLRMYWRLVASHGRLLRRIARRQGVVVGEWSGSFAQALFDRYPVSEHPRLVREHIEHQLHAYEYADAWFYWTYKTEARGVWHFRSLVEDGDIYFL